MGILVTGIGYIGSALVQRLLDEGQEVVGLDNYFSTEREAINRFLGNRSFRFVEGDITDRAAVDRAFGMLSGIDTVYHLAAQASAHPDAAAPGYTESTNLSGPRVVLDAMLEHKAGTFVFGSSFRVYGPRPSGTVNEQLPYGSFGDLSHLSKCYVEKLMEMYSAGHGLTCLPVRIGVTYGVAPVMKKDYRFMTAPNKFCLQVVRGETINVSASGASPTGFIHIEDAVQAMLTAAAGLVAYTPVNAVTGGHTVATVAEMVRDEAARRGLRAEVNTEVAAMTDSDLDVTSVLDGLGFRPKWTMASGVASTLDYFAQLAREAW